MTDWSLLRRDGLLAGITTVVVFSLSFGVRQVLLSWQIVDRPNERSSHRVPTVRGGGIAIMLGLAAVTLLFHPAVISAAMLGAAMLVAVISFIDDVRSLPARWRFGCHCLAACAMLLVLGGSHFYEQSLTTGGLLKQGIALIVFFLWITGYTNAFNFMDGINGLATGQAVITSIGMALIAGTVSGRWSAPSIVLGFVIAGATLGFLPHNFPRARMFMGDVGSAPLGFILASLALWLARDFGWWLLPTLALLHANFIIDTGFTLFRRMLRGEAWYQAHREHFYQRLIRAGKTHTLVTGLEMGLQVVVLLILLFSLKVDLLVRVGLMVLVVAIWGGFYFWAELTFRRSSAEVKKVA